jgi:hypothetical protein
MNPNDIRKDFADHRVSLDKFTDGAVEVIQEKLDKIDDKSNKGYAYVVLGLVEEPVDDVTNSAINTDTKAMSMAFLFLSPNDSACLFDKQTGEYIYSREEIIRIVLAVTSIEDVIRFLAIYLDKELHFIPDSYTVLYKE